MVRGIAQNLASDLLVVFGAAFAAGGAIWYFVPKARPWLIGGVAVCFLTVVFAGDQLADWARRGSNNAPAPKKTVLAAPARVDGLPLKDSYLRYDDGKLFVAVLSEDTEIQGWPAKGGEEIVFDSWGLLSAFTASRDLAIWDTAIKAGTLVEGGPAKGLVLTLTLPAGEKVILKKP
ncbi:MAG: hypothetical protein HYX27_25055 [Acidobacteria bacterium]|nr:hypothetical protein [Acidobacteriota bacterium]